MALIAFECASPTGGAPAACGGKEPLRGTGRGKGCQEKYTEKGLAAKSTFCSEPCALLIGRTAARLLRPGGTSRCSPSHGGRCSGAPRQYAVGQYSVRRRIPVEMRMEAARHSSKNSARR